MAALPPSADFTGGGVTEGGFKTAMAGLRDFLNGLFGATGTAADARVALGVTTDVAEAIVVAAATTNIGSAASSNVLVTGNTTITSFGTAAAGLVRFVRFSGTPVVTHNATSLILPGNVSITAAAGDCLAACSLGGGNWVVRFYQRKDGDVLVPVSTAKLGTGTANNTTFLRGDKTWQVVSTTPTTEQVLAANVGMTNGVVGAFHVAGQECSGLGGGAFSVGGTYASTTYRSLPAGSWRCLSAAWTIITAEGSGQPPYGYASLWLRVA
jgi:hypothetical protein